MPDETPRFQDLGAHDPVPPPVPATVDAHRDTGVRTVGGQIVPDGTPLAYLLDIMEQEPGADWTPEQRLYHERMRLEAAKTAAPFIHPRLAQIEHRGKVALTHEQALADLDGA